MFIPPIPPPTETNLRAWFRRWNKDIDVTRNSFNRNYSIQIPVKRPEGWTQGYLSFDLRDIQTQDRISAVYRTSGRSTHQLILKVVESDEKRKWIIEFFGVYLGVSLETRFLAAYYAFTGNFHTHLSQVDLSQVTSEMFGNCVSSSLDHLVSGYIDKGIDMGFVPTNKGWV